MLFGYQKLFYPVKQKTKLDIFFNQKVQFGYPEDLDEFNFLIWIFTEKKANNLESVEGENAVLNKLIIMHDVSGLADKSQEFSNFLTVSRKFGFPCVSFFHTIYPERQNWEIIMSQTHIFNFFPGSIHNSRILKTLGLFASRKKKILIYLIFKFG